MAQGYLITYEYKGKKGNDISKVGLVDWILKYREKFPGIVMEKFQAVDIPLGSIEAASEQVSIDNDLSDEPVLPDKVDEVVEEPVLPDEDPIKQQRIDNLKKAREAKQKKAEDGNSAK